MLQNSTVTTKGPSPLTPYSLSKPPGCCYGSILQVGKLRLRGVQGLSSPGHTAGIGCRQDLNQDCLTLQLHGLCTRAVPVRNQFFGRFLNNSESAEQPTHTHVSATSQLCTPCEGLEQVINIPFLGNLEASARKGHTPARRVVLRLPKGTPSKSCGLPYETAREPFQKE